MFMTLWNKLSTLPEFPCQNGEKMHGRLLNWGIGFIAGCGFLMFGYDQGVMSALLTLDDFQRTFPMATPYDTANPVCSEPGMCTGSPELQSNMVSIYQIGCFLGAIVILFKGDDLGRRSSSFWGTLVMIIGTVFQAAGSHYWALIVGRIIGGIGNGMVTSTIPTWQSECAKAEDRGFLVMNEGMLIAFGIAISYWIDYGFFFLTGSIRWRFPIAFQSFFSILVMIGILFLPDSPRWLLKKGRYDEALDVVARLADKPKDHPQVQNDISNVKASLAQEQQGGKFSFKELWSHGPTQHFRRTSLSILAQAIQQFSGINLITYYATFLFEDSLGFDAQMSRLLAACNGTEYWLAAVVAMFFIERQGRRPLMLVGCAGMSISMIILAATISQGVEQEGGSVELPIGLGVTATVFLFVFNTFFAWGLLGMTWLYPAEINPLRTRVQANAMSTCSNWLSNYVIVMITPPAFANIGYQTYIIFAIFNAVFIPIIWYWFPEPKGRSLEELDLIFAKAHAEGMNPVKMAKIMPKTEGKELEEELKKYLGDYGTPNETSAEDSGNEIVSDNNEKKQEST